MHDPRYKDEDLSIKCASTYQLSCRCWAQVANFRLGTHASSARTRDPLSVLEPVVLDLLYHIPGLSQTYPTKH